MPLLGGARRVRAARTSPAVNARSEEAQGPEGLEGRAGGDTTNDAQEGRRSREAIVRLDLKPSLEQRGDVHGLDDGARGETLVDLPILVGDDHSTIRNHIPLEAMPRSQARIIRARRGGIAGQTLSPIHKGIRRHGDSVPIMKKKRGSRGDKAGSVRLSYKGATASRRARDLIRCKRVYLFCSCFHEDIADMALFTFHFLQLA